jgi:CRISPR type IV-associated protein Csf2
MLMVRIQGVIRFTSPFHISAPGEARYDFNSNNFVYGAKQGTTCTTVRKDRIATRARLEEGQKPVTEIPNIPPDTLRGILRRKAAYRVIDAVLAKGQEVDLDTYHVLMCGAANGYPEGKSASVSEIKTAAANVYMGLFGGGPSIMPSCLRVDTAYPICPVTCEMELIPELFRSSRVDDNRLTQVQMFRRVDDLRGNIPANAKVIKDLDRVLDEWIVMTAPDDPDDETTAAIRGVQGWSSRETVIPGTPFAMSYEVETYDEAQIGLFLMALVDMLNAQKLGGKGSLGHGRFVVEDMLINDGNGNAKLLCEGATPYALNLENKMVASYVASAQEALAAIEADELVKICKPTTDPSERAAKKKLEKREKVERAAARGRQTAAGS